MKKILILICLFISGNALGAAVWGSNVKIKSFQILPDGSISLRTESGHLNSCGEHAAPFTIKVDERGVTQEGLNAMLSVIMAASFEDKDISINYDNELSCQSSSVTLTK